RTLSGTTASTSARARGAGRLARRAMRRNTSATPTAIGPLARVSIASRQFTTSITAAITPTSISWLSRSIVSVITMAKSCVSELTRLTIRPDAYLVEERHITPQQRGHGILAQRQHHIANRARAEKLADEVEQPAQRT